MTNELVKVNASDYGLDENKAKEITKGLSTILAERTALQEEYNRCITLEIEPENIPVFKDLRLRIRDNRTKGIEVWHKNNKAYFLAGGNFVDAIRRMEVAENERMEEKLQDAEKFFENQERERLEKLRTDRLELLRSYTEVEPLALGHMEQAVFDNLLTGFKVAHEAQIAAEKKAEEERIAREKAEAEERERQRLENIRLKAEAEERERLEKLRTDRLELLKPYTDVEPLALGHMEQAVFDNLLTGFKVAHEARIAAEKKAEEERIAREKAEAEERERQRLENIRLKAEAEEREKQIAAEREKARKEQEKKEAELAKEREKAEAERKALEDKARKEREEREKLEAEIQAKKEAEERAKQAEIKRQKDAEKAALKLPDKIKLTQVIRDLSIPDVELKSDESRLIEKEIRSKFVSFKLWCETQIKTL